MDVTEGFSHQITYAIDDLQNLDSKATAFSKTIVLPGSANNNILLGNIFEFGNANQSFTVGANVGYSFNASRTAKARLEFNGLQIMKGVIRLMEIIRDGELIEYEAALFGELGGFVSKLGNLRLEDLDFSGYNNYWNVSNIQDSWDAGNNLFIAEAQFNNAYPGIVLWGVFTQFNAGTQITVTGTTVSDGTYNIVSISYMPFFGQTLTLLITDAPTTDIKEYNFHIVLPRLLAEGVYYPLIDYGNVSTDKLNYSYKAFRPAFYVREYIDLIIKNSGYTWESKFMNSDFFCRLIIPNNDDALRKQGRTNFITATTTNFEQYVVAGGSAFASYFNVYWENRTYINFSFDGAKRFTYFETNAVGVVINATFSGTYINPAAFPFVGSSNNNTCSISLVLLHNGIESQLAVYNLPSTPNGQISPEFPYSFGLSATTQLVTGDKIYAKFNLVFGNGTGIYPAIRSQNASFIVDTDPPKNIEYNYGEFLLMNELLPKNVFQKDFFTSILKMFYLMVTEDNLINKHLIIEPYVGFYNLDPASYLDWSDDIDRSQVIKIKPMSELNARYYSLKYRQDSDYYNEVYRKKFNENYGDIIYDNGYEFAKETDTTEVIFAGTPLVGYDGKDKILSTIFKLNNAVEDSIAHIIRIMQIKKVEGVTAWNIYGLNTNYVTGLTVYPYAGHFDDPDVPAADINFGVPKELFFELVSGAIQNNLFNSFYSNYLAEITDKDSRLVTATIKLTEQQIFNLDFGRFIYLDGILYRIQRIIDYTAGELCKVELLRVIYTSYGNELNPYEKYTKITIAKNGNTSTLPTETLANFNSNFTDNNSYTSFKLITLENTYELYLYGGNNIEFFYYNLIYPFNNYVWDTIKFEDFGCITIGGFDSFSEATYCAYLSLPLMKEMPVFFGLALGYDINDIVIKLPALEVWIGAALDSVIGKNIELTIPHAMMVENAGSPNTKLQTFIDNNNVTIFEV